MMVNLVGRAAHDRVAGCKKGGQSPVGVREDSGRGGRSPSRYTDEQRDAEFS